MLERNASCQLVPDLKELPVGGRGRGLGFGSGLGLSRIGFWVKEIGVRGKGKDILSRENYSKK